MSIVNSSCAKAFYDLPSVTDSRKASIGYGKKYIHLRSRYDLTKQSQNNPAPNTYNPPDEVTTNRAKSRGFQFGVGREVSKYMIIENAPARYPRRSQ
jgi:hypothetical protein